MLALGWKKSLRLRLCFRVVDDVPEKKGIDLWKQMSSKWLFTCIFGIFLPLNPSGTTVYAQSAFYPESAVLILHFAPSLHFTLSLQSAVCILHSVCILPLVRSLQSAVCVLHSLIGNPISDGIVFKNELTHFPLLEAYKEGWKVSSDSGLTWWPSGPASRLVSLSNYCLWCVFSWFPEVELSLCDLRLYTCSL